MRQRFEQQMNLRTVAISDVRFPLKSRDELPPVLKALQYIFVTPELNGKVFSLLENKIVSGKKKTGRPGMDLWLSLIHISEPTRRTPISYAVFCLKKKK